MLLADSEALPCHYLAELFFRTEMAVIVLQIKTKKKKISKEMTDENQGNSNQH